MVFLRYDFRVAVEVVDIVVSPGVPLDPSGGRALGSDCSEHPG
jgi:hypothetical protein